jgi:eukaryotic-like serine/threonine-protein kinase
VWVGWSGNGRRALTASASRIQVWDAASGEALTPPLPHTHTICHAEVSADGSSLLSASADGTARLWRTGPARPRGEALRPVLRAFGPDGRQAVLRTAGERYQLWDLRERRCVAPILPESIGLAYAHTFNDRGDRLAVHHDNEISLFELRPQSPDAGIRRLGNWPAPWGCALRLSADGSMLALYGPPEVRLVDARSGELVVRMVEPAGAVRHAAFDRTNRRLLTTSDGGTARVWDVADGKPLVGPLRHDDAVVFGAFSPDDTQLVTAGYDGTARIWDATTGRMLIEPLRHGALVLAAEFSPDQRWLATVVGGNWVRVWDLTSGQAVAPPLSHRTGLHYVGFLGAGGPLLTVTDDLRYQVWELASGHPLNVTGLELDLTTLDPPVSVGEGDEMWLERLPIDRRPWAELERLSILITGHRVEGEGGLVPVEVARLREAWRGE